MVGKRGSVAQTSEATKGKRSASNDLERGRAKAAGGPTLPPGREGYRLALAPTHKAVRSYYEELAKFGELGARHEGAVRDAFGTLLKHCASQVGWTLVGEDPYPRRGRNPAKIDGALLDRWNLRRAYWEAKDSDDDLRREVRKKLSDGYPSDNIIFQAPDRAIVFQNGREVCDQDISTPQALIDVLHLLFRYRPTRIEDWELAADEFGERVPQLSEALAKLIEDERKHNPDFVRAFDDFCEICRSAINPDIGKEAVDRMLVQHLLTERIFRRVFNNPDFATRNVIAVELEKVIRALTKRSFNRDAFLANLERFYHSLEATAADITEYEHKQFFLNRVYERFFQGFDEKAADTHGIVYTPQPVAHFIVRSVDEILRKEFGTSLGSRGVHIIDPFVGTGNFIMEVMRTIPKTQLAHKYANELHANEIMLLPYYVAAMNIEHEYLDRAGQYEPFEGLCLVDTFGLAEPLQQRLAFVSETNSRRVERQKRSPIFVVLGNPPYNAGQEDENDNNKNRSYPALDRKIRETYGRDSRASLVNSLGDPYVRAFRWATDRIGDEGIIAFVTNNRFIDGKATDAMRRELAADFSAIYHIDLKGDARTTGDRRRREGGNIFLDHVRVGVGVTLLVRRKGHKDGSARIYLSRVDDYARSPEKLDFLESAGDCSHIEWTEVHPDKKYTWLRDGLRDDFDTLVPLVPADGDVRSDAIFLAHSNGLKSNSDPYVFSFNHAKLTSRAGAMVDAYEAERKRWESSPQTRTVEDFVRVDERILKWIRKTKRSLQRGQKAVLNKYELVPALYRPFTRQWAFFNKIFNEDVYRLPTYFPRGSDNIGILVTIHSQIDFSCQATDRLPCMDAGGRPTFFFPLYAYADGEKREQITDWSLAKFRAHYADSNISRMDIFRYVYAVLHHEEYRSRYKANLKRDLPRIPLISDFWSLAKAGERLVKLHLDYESLSEWPLNRQETPGVALDWLVRRMKLSSDRKAIVYNDFLSLVGVPETAFEYRIGNRSAVEWIIDQYRISTDKRSGIVNDPNRRDDPEYIVRLVGKVIRVSVETMKIVRSLPPLD